MIEFSFMNFGAVFPSDIVRVQTRGGKIAMENSWSEIQLFAAV